MAKIDFSEVVQRAIRTARPIHREKTPEERMEFERKMLRIQNAEARANAILDERVYYRRR